MTVYGHVSRLSSCYQWALQDPLLASRIPCNPVRLARPKAPRAYQAESTQALSDVEMTALLQVVKRRADAGDLVGLRDYAMLLFYALTGMHRAEIASLRWGDVRLGETLTLTAQVKGVSIPLTAHLGLFGIIGPTAYFGLLDIGKPQAGETLVVSAAAGAVQCGPTCAWPLITSPIS